MYMINKGEKKGNRAAPVCEIDFSNLRNYITSLSHREMDGGLLISRGVEYDLLTVLFMALVEHLRSWS